jgi:hypothetical protein
MSDYKVMRAFERHDGKALRKYKRGAVIGPQEAAKIPHRTMQRLIGAGNIFPVPSQMPTKHVLKGPETPQHHDGGQEEVKGDGV